MDLEGASRNMLQLPVTLVQERLIIVERVIFLSVSRQCTNPARVAILMGANVYKVLALLVVTLGSRILGVRAFKRTRPRVAALVIGTMIQSQAVATVLIHVADTWEIIKGHLVVLRGRIVTHAQAHAQGVQHDTAVERRVVRPPVPVVVSLKRGLPGVTRVKRRSPVPGDRGRTVAAGTVWMGTVTKAARIAAQAVTPYREPPVLARNRRFTYAQGVGLCQVAIVCKRRGSRTTRVLPVFQHAQAPRATNTLQGILLATVAHLVAL